MIDVSSNGEGNAGPLTSTNGTAGRRRVQIKVNGITIEVGDRIQIREMLVQARNAGAIVGIVEEYAIERIESEGQLKIDEAIDVIDLEEFVAVPIGPTEVARFGNMY